MRLYESTIPSANAYKVSLLLAQLGIAHETTELDILASPSETRRPPYLAKNPNGRVPLLELDDGRFLPESNAILFYLAEGTRFLADDPFERAQTLSWMFFEQYSLEPNVSMIKYFTYWGDLAAQSPERLERLRTLGQKALNVLATHLESRRYMVGERYGIADIALFAYTQSATAVGFQVAAPVQAWLDRVIREPGYVPIKADPTGKAPAGRVATELAPG
ncbi:glutathione S-transferase family protein [Haliangium sp.]|uniref:glutathione S-transferase family protein n=1 Tax=Haliangium sp. TaxID=2663208 RepID=UPI003D09EBD8